MFLRLIEHFSLVTFHYTTEQLRVQSLAQGPNLVVLGLCVVLGLVCLGLFWFSFRQYVQKIVCLFFVD